jgi:acetyl-CoA carboxylase biotin carboxyl carrier protein
VADNDVIRSPIPGVFYRRPSPGEPAFAEQGDAVEPGTVVGLIEVMKQFHELQAESGGVIREFAVENEGVVGAGDVVVHLDAAAG